MNVLPKNLQQVCHTTEPKWTEIPVEQLAEFTSPRFLIVIILHSTLYAYTQYVSLVRLVGHVTNSDGLNRNKGEQTQ